MDRKGSKENRDRALPNRPLPTTKGPRYMSRSQRRPKEMTQAAHKRGSQLAPKHYCSQGLPSAALLQEHALASSLRMHPTITAQHAALLTRPASWRWRRSSWPAKVARRQGTTWHWLTAWHYKKRKLLGCRLLPHDVMDMPTANPIPPYPCAHDTLL